jgi:N-acyl-D-amino-acid deacylase
MEYDLIIRGGTIVDGTGRDAYPGDIAIAGDRIVAIGRIEGEAGQVFDASGLIVAPGFVDVHTHYDAQIEWDPLLTPSSWNGVTTVLAGNCGFGLAPAKPEDLDWLVGMLCRVEGMPRASLDKGLTFKGGSFADYWGRFGGKLGINIGSFVTHCAVRRYVMGDAASERTATGAEIEAMKVLVREGMEQGAIGFSSSQLRLHVGEDGREVPSNFASPDEIVALCSVLADFDHGAIEFIPRSGNDGPDEEDCQLIREMYAVSGKPIELAPIGYYNDWKKSVDFADAMTAEGVRVHPMLSLNRPDFHLCLNDTGTFDDIAAIKDVLCLPQAERLAKLRDPAVRAAWREALAKPGNFPIPIGGLLIERATTAANAGLVGRKLAEVAAERGVDLVDCFIDLSLSEDLMMSFIFPMGGEQEVEWRRVNRELLTRHPQVVIGSSDGGAHLNAFVGADYTTRFLTEWVPDVLTLEQAIHRLTEEPATIHGLKDRGVLKAGYKADIICFDQAALAARPSRLVEDFPAGGARYVCDAEGYRMGC